MGPRRAQRVGVSGAKDLRLLFQLQSPSTSSARLIATHQSGHIEPIGAGWRSAKNFSAIRRLSPESKLPEVSSTSAEIPRTVVYRSSRLGEVPMKKLAALFAFVFALAMFPVASLAQQQDRSLWIDKFSADAKAASAVASVQMSTANALKYSNLFATVKTFDTDAKQPEGTWLLTAKEVEFSGGSTAKRALIGFGSGRAKITMEYTLTDASKKAVWTKKITTKPSYWGAAGAMGAVQNQSGAVDEQAQKLVNALTSFFSPDKESAKK